MWDIQNMTDKNGTEKFCTWNTVGTKIALNCHLLNCLHSKRYGTTGWQCRALTSVQEWIRLNWIWINTTFHGVPRVHIFSIRLWDSIALNNVQGGIGENHANLLSSFFNIEVGKLVEGQASGKVPLQLICHCVLALEVNHQFENKMVVPFGRFKNFLPKIMVVRKPTL